MNPSHQQDMRQLIRETGMGFRPAAILLAANAAGIFTALGRETLSAEAVAQKLAASRRGTEIILNALVSLGFLQKHDRLFEIHPEARPFLLPGSPQYLGDMLRHDFNLMKRWVHLPQIIRTGEPVRHETEAENPTEKTDFILAMGNLGWQSAETFAQKVDLSAVKRLLDLGGGPAVFSITLCQKFPQLESMVFDTPETIAIAEKNIAHHCLENRITTQSGNFFEDDIRGTFDAALLSSIIHIYGPGQNQSLLKNVYAVLSPGGRVYIRDFFLEEDKTQPLSAALFAVNMLVNTRHGNCYTQREVESWLQTAGFTPEGKIELDRGSDVVVGKK